MLLLRHGARASGCLQACFASLLATLPLTRTPPIRRPNSVVEGVATIGFACDAATLILNSVPNALRRRPQ